jgi:hypothetical protein
VLVIDASKPVALDNFPNFRTNRCEAMNGDLKKLLKQRKKVFVSRVSFEATEKYLEECINHLAAMERHALSFYLKCVFAKLYAL